MELLNNLISVLPNVFSFGNMLALFAGVLGGIIIGALPGLTPTMGVAILVPFTFGMSPDTGLILLGGVYCGSVYAGAITAILFNIPGSPANIATLFDGHPMAKQGKAREAIYYATTASFVGGIVGMLALLLLSPPLAQMSLKFGPAEIFWVAIFGVTIIASLSVGTMLKGLIGGAIGLLLSTVGMDSVTATYRYTFDSDILLAGIDIVAGLIGLFALSQVFSYFEQTITQPKAQILQVHSEDNMLFKTIADTFRRKRALCIGSIVGTIIGIIPGAGGQVAALTAYNEVKRWTPEKERKSFGKGNPDGIIACESANNAMAGGSLIPLFTLGIPGSPTAAVLLGGLIIHGLFPGHQLYSVSADVTYTFMVAMILAQFVMFGIGIAITGHMTRILIVPKYFLGPGILPLCIIGAFAIRNSMGDVYVMATLGILMYFGLKFGFSAAAVVLGLILGGIAENGFLLGVRIGAAEGSAMGYLLTRPIPMIVIALSLLSIGFALFLEHKERVSQRNQRAQYQSGQKRLHFGNWWSVSEMSMRQWNLVIGLGLLIGSVLVYGLTKEFPNEPRQFPMVLVVSLIMMAIWLIIQSLVIPSIDKDSRPLHKLPVVKMGIVFSVTILYIALVKVTGFYVSTFLFMFGVPIYLNNERKGRFFIKCFCVSAGYVLIMLLVFHQLLKVPTPVGWLL